MALLEKNRQKRASIESALGMEWFSEFKDVAAARRGASPENRFKAFTTTTTSDKDINAEIARVAADLKDTTLQ